MITGGVKHPLHNCHKLPISFAKTPKQLGKTQTILKNGKNPLKTRKKRRYALNTPESKECTKKGSVEKRGVDEKYGSKTRKQGKIYIS